eukprot:875393-Pyramimonas_sp.AAC.1
MGGACYHNSIYTLSSHTIGSLQSAEPSYGDSRRWSPTSPDGRRRCGQVAVFRVFSSHLVGEDGGGQLAVVPDQHQAAA